MTKKTALLLENIHPAAHELLAAAGYEVRSEMGSLHGDELLAVLDGVSLLGIRSATTIDAATLAAAPSLEAIGAFCIGTNQIDLAAASAQGVAVFNAPYANTRSVVELTLGEMIMLARRVPEKSRQMHTGQWHKSAAGSSELRGKTLGIVGYGNIGSQLSILAEAMGMNVRFYDADDKLALGNARACTTLGELLEQSDFVTVHVDGRKQNASLIGAAEFAQMKDGAVFINNARGHVVDADALAAALESGKLSGAAADVFANEPDNGDEFQSVLRGKSNVILTPHIGGATQEAQEQIGVFVAKKLLRYIERGGSQLSVNFPGLSMPLDDGAHRLLYVHQNVPGAMAHLNDIFKAANINIVGQYLATKGELGYALIDIESDYSAALATDIANLPEAIRVRSTGAQ